MKFGTSVWNRSIDKNTLSPRAYTAAVTGSTVLGLATCALVALKTLAWHPTLGALLAVGLVLPFMGILIAFWRDEWYLSLAGYLLVVTGLGAIMGPSVAFYETSVVLTALFATGGVTVVMSLVGILYPNLLQGWGRYLFAALVALMLVRIGQVVALHLGMPPAIAKLPFVDYIAAALFSVYIMYDWGRALSLPRTLDNAIDASVAIFLDVVNLFTSLLRIFSK